MGYPLQLLVQSVRFLPKNIALKFKRVHLFIAICLLSSNASFAWGPEGHAMVGRLAMQFVREDVRKNILSIIGPMSIDTAANWMDIMKSNPDYEFMRSWHYVDFARGTAYQTNNNDNIVNRLILTYNELSHKQTLCTGQVKTDLYVLLHLMGDLHMPLHTGYDEDMGGNKRIVQFGSLKTHNLHTFWDIDIIEFAKITDGDVLKHVTKETTDTLRNADFLYWMNDSRMLLDNVYNFPDFTLSNEYLAKNKVVVEKQLLKAAIRLAFILNKLFSTPDPLVNIRELTTKYSNGIITKDAGNSLQKKVTVCARVVAVRSTPSITQVSLDDRFPNCPLTLIVFAKNYSKFASPLEELLKEKNICIKGEITEYNGKLQIVIEDPKAIDFF